jgi:hypothetical protein
MRSSMTHDLSPAYLSSIPSFSVLCHVGFLESNLFHLPYRVIIPAMRSFFFGSCLWYPLPLTYVSSVYPSDLFICDLGNSSLTSNQNHTLVKLSCVLTFTT